MTRFLCSEKHPEGSKLEDLLMHLRAELIQRCEAIATDHRPEALSVMNNNLKILAHMSELISLALDSTRILDRAFGPSQSAHGGPPRIGKTDKAA
ncbi:MAG: histidine kinase [Alphaproteobacteria bacterium]|nr:histidine kinase [Alphaproteobacteria bacterium]